MNKFFKCALSLLLALVLVVAPMLTSAPKAAAADKAIAGSSLPQVHITVTDGVHNGTEITKDTGYVSASVEIVDPTNGKNYLLDAGSKVKVRGNSTAWGAKRPYNIKLSAKTKVLGMGKGKKWCLLANMFDKSLLRNNLVFHFASSIGMDYTSEFRMVDVWMEDTYMGNYMLCEPVDAGTNQVDIDVDNGDYLFEREKDRVEDGAYYLTTSRYDLRFVAADPEELTDAQYSDLLAKLNAVETAIATNDYNTIAQYIDMKSFVDMYIIEEYFKDVDADYSSAKYYFKNGVLYAGPVWDFDLACGNCDAGSYPEYNNVGGSGNSYEGFYASTAIWFRYLLENEQFASEVKARFFELQPQIVNLYEDNELGRNRIDQVMEECAASFAANWTVWGESSKDSSLERNPAATHAQNVEYLRNWLKQRNAWMSYVFSNDVSFISRWNVNYSNLPSGVYCIANAANANFQLDVNDASTASGANVQIWRAHDGNNQKWIFWNMGNGYYTIENLNSGKYLDVPYGNSASGTNIWQCDYNGTAPQQWRVVDNGDGSCTLISRLGNVALDMNGGGMPANGTNVQIWDNNGTTAQKWMLKPQAVLEDGTYSIRSTQDNNYCLDVSGVSYENAANIHVWQNVNGNNQKFQIKADKDGYYTITAVHSGKVVDVNGAYTTAGTNIQQYEANGTDAQKWLAVPYNGNYIFISKCNGLALDLYGNWPGNGTNVQCWTLNWDATQIWNLKKLCTNHVAVTDPAVAATCSTTGLTEGSHCSVCGAVLVAQQTTSKLAHTPVTDAAVAPTENTTGLTEGSHCSVCGEVIVAQQVVPAIRPDVDYSNLPSGVYTIGNAADVNYRLDVNAQSRDSGANVHIWSAHNANSQKWIFWNMGNGYYTIENLNSGKYLDVPYGNKAAGTNIWQCNYIGGDPQQWRVVNNGDGTCTLVSKLGNVALDMNGGGQPANGTNIQIWDRNNSTAQKWVLTPQTVLASGTYSFCSAANTNFCLDVSSVSTANGANIQLWTNANSNNQKFKVEAGKDGYYTITAVHSGKVVDVSNANKTNGTNVQQYEANGTNAQKWLAIPYNGSYMFVSKCNGLALDVNGGVAANGSNVQCWAVNWTNAQLWKLR